MTVKQRGKKSVAALTVAPLGANHKMIRLAAPRHLTGPEKEVWLRCAAAFSAHHGPLLEQYCRHAVQARIMAELVRKFRVEWISSEEGLRRYDKLLAMQARQTSLVSATARSLRLTRQSVDKKTAGWMEINAPRYPEPWRPVDEQPRGADTTSD
jgi:hypothetical protein